MPQDRRNRSHLLLAFAALLTLGLASCATKAPEEPPVPKAPMDVALDISGQGMFYKGTGFIPRSFNSATSFEMDFELAHWSHPFGGGIGAQAHALLGPSFKESGTYQPLQNGEGVISLASGRVLLRGIIADEGKELDGDWFLDGKKGGGFRIAQKGYIFP